MFCSSKSSIKIQDSAERIPPKEAPGCIMCKSKKSLLILNCKHNICIKCYAKCKYCVKCEKDNAKKSCCCF